MKRTLIMSDFLDEIEMFERLLVDVKYDPDHDQLILLGDYVDWSPAKKGTC
ncbi:hypothetical protein [Sporosarcina sp. E16_8]|uniref:hypothetical protein n=1 Tax=Sporosarcina sp. E16_8 TaxID=2789295 RepID=UPI001A931C3B|nr:hypothetical protein [Sporosarcina sp. E16_8]MBO0586272.1 hypothetical protein [Sporosarcina sp. E16_8]